VYLLDCFPDHDAGLVVLKLLLQLDERLISAVETPRELNRRGPARPGWDAWHTVRRIALMIIGEFRPRRNQTKA
jgi:hypothetical protein